MFPSNKDCYAAMAKLSEYYMEGEQRRKWRSIIENGLNSQRTPPGKGFLQEIDYAMRNSTKTSMGERKELYDLICNVCI